MSTPDGLNGRPLPPGWIPHYDEQGNVWFDIQGDDEDSYQSLNRSALGPSPPAGAMAVASPSQKPLSKAQRLYASALPLKYSDQQPISQDPAESTSSRPSTVVHFRNATVLNSSDSDDTCSSAPHRTQTYQTPPAPPRISENFRHRASTYSAPSNTSVGPTDVPTVSLVARRPVSSNAQNKSYPTSNATAASSNPPQHNTSSPALTPLRPPIPHYRTAAASIPPPSPPPPHHVPSPPTVPSRPPTTHYSTTPGSAHSNVPHLPLSPMSTVNASFPVPFPPHSSPSTITRFSQAPPETQLQPSHLPSAPLSTAGSFQRTSSLPPPAATVSDTRNRSLLTDVEKIAGTAALKYVGSAASNSLTSGGLSGDALAGLSTIFQGFNFGDALGAFDISQLQNVMQGQSRVDYQSIIDAITQQASQQAPGVDYQSIINELANLQNQSYPPSAPPAVDYQAQLQVITQQAQVNYQDANVNMRQDIMSISQHQQQAAQQMASAVQQQQSPLSSFSNSGGPSQPSTPLHHSAHSYAGQHSHHHNVPVSHSGYLYHHSHGYVHHAQTAQPHTHTVQSHHSGHRF